MKFVSRGRTNPAKVETLAEPRQGTPLRAIIAPAMTYQFLQLRRKQSADGTAFLGRYNSDLSQDFGVKFECNIRFHD
jgi:hypothetical protein